MGTGGIVVRYVAVEDEGEDEGGGAIANNNGVDMGWDRSEEHNTIRGSGAWTMLKKLNKKKKKKKKDALGRWRLVIRP